MCGYLSPTSGSVRLLGKNPRAGGAVRGKVGVLPQDALLPASLPVGTLLTSWARLQGLSQSSEEAKNALARVGLSDTWRVAAGTLSHGMTKRVALAQALMGSPPLLLLDEPTAGLDPKVAAEVRAIIADQKGKATVVVSSHNLQELEQLCDSVALLDHGKLTEAGTLSQFTAQQAEFHIDIASGSVPLAEVKALPQVTEVLLSPSGRLTVRFNPEGKKAEGAISETLQLLLQRGVLVLGVQRGRRLEDRVLELTA
jgi:ABC-2 type transport system ATP-binding protein